MSALLVAQAHYRRRARRARLVEREAARLWRQVDRSNIAGSWASLMLRLLIVVTETQRAAAAEADGYLTAVTGLDPPGVNADALAGVASDGWPLDSLLLQPVVTAKVALARGATTTRAMTSGLAALQMIAATQVADAGRVADGIAVAATPRTSYVRMVVGATCARCLILAGRSYGWNRGFLRHPKCDCIHIPADESTAGDLTTSPKAAFTAMDRAEQDRVFGAAGAEAIREGADMARVVNARRGMYTAGGRRFTTEATTRRGTGRRVRLMPEQIFTEANGDRAEAVRLLRLHGYLL